MTLGWRKREGSVETGSLETGPLAQSNEKIRGELGFKGRQVWILSGCLSWWWDVRTDGDGQRYQAGVHWWQSFVQMCR